jgi:Phosphoesterase family
MTFVRSHIGGALSWYVRSLSLVSLNCVLILLFSVASGAEVVPLAQHVVLVVEENTSFNTTFNNMPWLVSEGNKYGYADNYTTDVNGSLLEYLYLASGSCESAYRQCGGAPACSLPPGGHNFFCNGNDCYMANSCVSSGKKDPITDENIFHLMNTQPVSWKVYVQNYLNAGGNVNAADYYASNQPPYTHYYARHNAAVWYEEILNNVLGSQGNIVDFEQFGIDVAQGTLPRFAIIVPDGCWDGHDGCFSSPARSADDFLKSNLTSMLNLPDFKPGGSGLLIVTFDNGDGDGAGKVYTALVGPNVKSRYVSSAPYKHENTLRTMLDALGIGTYPGWSGSVPDMSDFFAPKAGSVVIDSPATGSVQGATVLVKAAASELGEQIDHLEVWDLYNGRSTKLGDIFTRTIDSNFPISGNGLHQIIVQDIGAATHSILHRQTTTFTTSSTYGSFVTSPANHSTQAMLFPLSAFAVESGAQSSAAGVDHIEVWNGNTKLGDSPKATSLSQWYSLPPGSYTLTVKNVSSTGAPLHQNNLSFAVSSGRGVYVNSPANNSTWQTTTVPINAYAYEQNGSSTPLVDHLEVWDNTHGVKLGQSPTGVGVNSLFINQTVTLPRSGTYQLAINDVDGNSFRTIHTTYVTVTVK